MYSVTSIPCDTWAATSLRGFPHHHYHSEVLMNFLTVPVHDEAVIYIQFAGFAHTPALVVESRSVGPQPVSLLQRRDDLAVKRKLRSFCWEYTSSVFGVCQPPPFMWLEKCSCFSCPLRETAWNKVAVTAQGQMPHLDWVEASDPGNSVPACRSVNQASDEEMFLSCVDGSQIPTNGKAGVLMETVRNKDKKKEQREAEKLTNALDQLTRRPAQCLTYNWDHYTGSCQQNNHFKMFENTSWINCYISVSVYKPNAISVYSRATSSQKCIVTTRSCCCSLWFLPLRPTRTSEGSGSWNSDCRTESNRGGSKELQLQHKRLLVFSVHRAHVQLTPVSPSYTQWPSSPRLATGTTQQAVPRVEDWFYSVLCLLNMKLEPGAG